MTKADSMIMKVKLSKKLQRRHFSLRFHRSGNLKNWWEESTVQEFVRKTKCIIWQYGNYTTDVKNLTLNGINTQGENIADNGGIKEAYYAYSKGKILSLN